MCIRDRPYQGQNKSSVKSDKAAVDFFFTCRSCGNSVLSGHEKTNRDVYKRQDLDTAHQRIYSRILEMCVPIYCGGEDKRKEEGTEKLVQVQHLITG